MQISPPDVLAPRVERLRRALAARDLDALLVTSLPNVAYLTGFFASAGAAVVTPAAIELIGDSRYQGALESRAGDFSAIKLTIVEPGVSYDESIVRVLASLSGLQIGFEAEHLSVQRHRSLAQRLAALEGAAKGLQETEGLVEDLRIVKDAWETERLRDGGVRLSDVAKCILRKALAGRTESDVALEIEAELRRAGFERASFDTIVAAGPNAALPHARASRRRIERGELVVLDFGGVLDGYCTDLTRTVVAGSAGGREQLLIRQVAEAQLAAFQAVAPGRQPEAVDEAARAALARFELDRAFTHGTGHGLGLEIHERPRLTRARTDHAEPPLASGMVMTLEPGVYFPGWGGVRIEDDVIVTEVGAEWLTDVPRTL